MTSISHREVPQAEEKEPLDAHGSALTQPTADLHAWGDAPLGVSGGHGERYWKHTNGKGDGWRQARRLRRRIGWFLLYVLIPAIIISVLRELCRANLSTSTNRARGVSARRLSEGDEGTHRDSSIEQLIEACAAIEADMGLPTPQERTPAQELDAAEQVARIAFSLYAETVAYEQVMHQTPQTVHTSLTTLPPSHTSSGIHSQHQHFHGSVSTAGQQPAAQHPQHITTGLTTSDLQPASHPHEPSALPPQFLGAPQHLLSGTQPLLPESSHPAWLPQGALASSQPGFAYPQYFAGPQPPVGAPQSVGLPSQVAALLPENAAQRAPRKRSYLEGPHGTSQALDPDSWLDVSYMHSPPERQWQSPAYFSQYPHGDQSAPPSRGTSQALDPDSWLDVSYMHSPPERQWQSPAYFSQYPHGDQSAPPSSAAKKYPLGGTKRWATWQSSSTSSVAGAGAAPAAGAAADPAREAFAAAGDPETTVTSSQANRISKHPFVQLPVLKRGVVPPHIPLTPSDFRTTNGASVRDTLLMFRRLFMEGELSQMDATLLGAYVQELAIASETTNGASVRDTLLMFRRLFMGGELSQMDATLLGAYVQELAIASAARARATKRMNRPLHCVMTIGRHFLVLDAIVSALHVLGVSPPSCTWWEAFVECFDTDYRYTAAGRRVKESGKVNIDLANRLLAAITIFKTGNRPDLEEIIHLKWILFFSVHSPWRFRAPAWDTWRRDYLEFQEKEPELAAWLVWRRQLPH
ncbi:uncharacterized protein EMH_0034280 [Eimeria mitis]|uniref:Uncharacterized protein n=1 Tax=Eimeria mitis TaxID=44415 RepID=U6JQF9_9EIME|nr:uncharacterized protein EMH_0034280 [Eimeria mitis]CDJ27730.1 hypothetical protein EMH_0034280 [Eimeria mitis]